MTLTRKKWIYGVSCVVSVLIGLYPSFFLNAKPYLMHGEQGMAAVQCVLALIAAAIPLVMFSLSFFEGCLAVVLLGAILFASIGNGMESITLVRSEFAAEHETKSHSLNEWSTRVETLVSQQLELKKRYIPLGEAREYTPTSEEIRNAAREGRDMACKYSSVTENCKNTQNHFALVSQNYELTKRVDALEQAKADAERKMSEIGTPPPDHLALARQALNGAWINPLANRETSLALVGEGVAAFSPKIMISLVDILFVAMFGAAWSKTDRPRESLPSERDTQRESPVTVTMAHPKTPLPAPKKMAGLRYLPGVQAWVESVKPAPGGSVKRYAPKDALPFYQDFCKAAGFPFAVHETTLGGLLKNGTDLVPITKVGGRSYYALNIRSAARLTLLTGTEQ